MSLYKMKRFEKHRTWIFYITPAMYLLYMAFAGVGFAYDNKAYYTSFGPAGWVIMWVTIDINSNARYLNWQYFPSSWFTGSYFNVQLRWHRSFSYLSHRWWCLSWWWVRSGNFLFWPGFVRKTDAVLFHFLCDLQIVFVLVFLVIVPLCNPAGNLWNLMTEAVTSGLAENHSVSQTPLLSSIFVENDWHAFFLSSWYRAVCS